jgi:hypothetical protein
LIFSAPAFQVRTWPLRVEQEDRVVADLRREQRELLVGVAEG